MSRELRRIRFGQHQMAGALTHALDVPIHAKHVNRAVGMPKCLEALEAGARVVQHMRRRDQFDRRHRLDLGLAPAAVPIGGNGHVGGQHGAECGSLGVVPSWGLHLGYENHRRMLEQLFQRLNHRRRIIAVHEAMIE